MESQKAILKTQETIMVLGATVGAQGTSNRNDIEEPGSHFGDSGIHIRESGSEASCIEELWNITGRFGMWRDALLQWKLW